MTDAAAIAQKYYASLPHRSLYRQKCIVLFSGVPGSGKSYVARAIEQDLGAMRISNDDIRELIMAEIPGIEFAKREELKLQVVANLLEPLAASPNGLVVFDSSCDRPNGYEFFQDWVDKNGYRIILLRMDIPRAVVEERIRQRGDSGYRKADRFLFHLDTWWKQWEDFGKRHTPDMVVTLDTPIEDVIKLVLKQI